MEQRFADSPYKIDLFPAAALPCTKLPTYADVMKAYFYEHNQNPDSSFANLRTAIALQIKKLYEELSIPTIALKTIVNKIKEYDTKYKDLLKIPLERRNTPAVKSRIAEFSNSAAKLFDVASCRCERNKQCTCLPELMIPEKMKDFLDDQRTIRQRIIPNVKINLRKPVVLPLPLNEVIESVEDEDSNISKLESSISELSVNDSEYLQSQSSASSQLIQHSNQMRVSLRNLIIAIDRTGVSQRNAAIIANAVLQDVGLISSKNTSLVISKSKIVREQKKFHKTLSSTPAINDDLLGLYFDGRKDVTIQMVQKGTKYYRKEFREEHVTILKEPGEVYLSHVTPTSGCAVDILNAILEYLKDENIDTSKLMVIGCDGTPVNTGHNGGIIKLLEKKLNRPLHWFVCQIHANELILRHLFEAYDGKKTGPKAFSGPISKSLTECEKLPVSSFERVTLEDPLPEVETKQLSKDQQYLLEMARAVSNGEVCADLANRNPGPISHSRWLTIANRLLRLYVSSTKPSKHLRNLVILIIKVYVPVWFSIKKNPECYNGPQHLHKTIQLSRCLDQEIRAIVDPVIQRNAYFSHPENLLLAMIVDDRLEIRMEALNKIVECREMSSDECRPYRLPQLNFNAEDYTEIINWQEVTEPPLTRDITEAELRRIVIEDYMELRKKLPYPCHTQAVERHIKIVTEVSQSVCGYKARQEKILGIIQSRKAMPTFELKKDYVPFHE